MTKIISNNPERRSNSFPSRIKYPFTPKFPNLRRRSVRTLVKVDPNNAQGTPPLEVRPGIIGRMGVSPVRRILGHTEAKGRVQGTAKDGVSRKIPMDKGKNTKLLRR